MKKTDLKKASVILFAGVLFFSIFAISANAQRSKQIRINRLATKGYKEVKANQFEAAIKTFNQCIALKPLLQNANACYFGRALGHFSKKDFEEAIPDFDKAFRSIINHQARYMKGRSYFELKKYDEALKDFDFVIKLAKVEDIKTLYPEVYAFRGVILAGRGEFDRAIADYTKTIELKPTYTDAYFSRGIAYELKEDLDNAEKDLKKALELDPTLKEKVEEIREEIDAIRQSNPTKTFRQ